MPPKKTKIFYNQLKPHKFKTIADKQPPYQYMSTSPEESNQIVAVDTLCVHPIVCCCSSVLKCVCFVLNMCLCNNTENWEIPSNQRRIPYRICKIHV